MQLKENEKSDKYFDLGRELKKLRNMKVTIIPIVVNVLGIITKGLVQGLEDLEITARRVLENWGNLLSLKLQWKTIS